MAGLDLGGKDAGPLVSRLDTYYEDPDLVKGKVSMSHTLHYKTKICESANISILHSHRLSW